MWGFTIVWGVFIGLPFLAPVLMNTGLEGLGSAAYTIYSFLCHQLPQRSFFLFGSKVMYSLDEIQNVYGYTTNPSVLRQFIGNPVMGWKVAWSDRMVYMYSAILPFAWVWYAFRKRLDSLSLWGFAIFLLPMALDGGTHMISDLAGYGHGFRYDNSWLMVATGNAFPQTFYVGNGLGSFNSWMRLITGVMFAMGVVWFGFPVVQEMFDEIYVRYKNRFEQLEILESQLADKLALTFSKEISNE